MTPCMGNAIGKALADVFGPLPHKPRARRWVLCVTRTYRRVAPRP